MNPFGLLKRVIFSFCFLGFPQTCPDTWRQYHLTVSSSFDLTAPLIISPNLQSKKADGMVTQKVKQNFCATSLQAKLQGMAAARRQLLGV